MLNIGVGFLHIWLYRQKKPQSDLSLIFSKAYDVASHKFSAVGNKNLHNEKRSDWEMHQTGLVKTRNFMLGAD